MLVLRLQKAVARSETCRVVSGHPRSGQLRFNICGCIHARMGHHGSRGLRGYAIQNTAAGVLLHPTSCGRSPSASPWTTHARRAHAQVRREDESDGVICQTRSLGERVSMRNVRACLGLPRRRLLLVPPTLPMSLQRKEGRGCNLAYFANVP
ncbi:uncharacterized protein LOC127749707 [Frankliniella occidentalis]|uniref:Uncharacterized protein LOC127749707 n=1 Tax=Frankliniella occidentalis TaxID=133901 RepID=A0A9C6U8I2_FRAOC|nr:uncharacterized protein LOC127749707 [Frankliniella occidentalis]